VALDSLAEFTSEEALPPRPRRAKTHDAALDAFEDEASAFADPSIRAGTSAAGTSRLPDADDDRRAFVLPPWRSMAMAAGVAGVIAVGLLVKQPGHLPVPTDTARSSAPVTPAETRAPDLRPTTAVPQMQARASSIAPPAEPDRPLLSAPSAPKSEPAASAAMKALAARSADAPATSSSSATTGTVMASSQSPTIDAGIGAVLPAAGPVPEIPPVNVPAPLAAADDSPPPAAEPARPSAQDQVNAVLGHFQAGYSRLNAGVVQAIWPSVDRPRLERAFRNLEWQRLEFSQCRLDVTGAAATAICTGIVEYGTRVGGQRAREARRWTFALREESAGWLIQNVQTR
jgi:hypothetical protein